uniref:PAS domain-containing protein n=1 Tax=Enterobius vermicularis TaxID=51028 RepID=A0A0N4VEP3_ENTVE
LIISLECLHRSSYITDFSFLFSNTYPYLQTRSSAIRERVPLIITSTGQLLTDPKDQAFEEIALKVDIFSVPRPALGGFILILNENGEIYYASENIESYLGFHQSDILHQPLFEMIHSEDREEIRRQLNWRFNLPSNFTCLQDVFTAGGIYYLERNVSARFRCLLDNTCGFLRIDMRGKLMALHGIPRSFLLGRNDTSNSGSVVLGLIAICSPFVPPIEQFAEDPILKTKHSLDMTLISMDNRIRTVLELSDKNLPRSFYTLIHTDDIFYVAEAHREVSKNGVSGLLIYRIVSARSCRIYWVQSSCRMFYKNGKPESIGLTHRLLTEVEGTMLLEKQGTLRTKVLSFDNPLMAANRNPPNNELLQQTVRTLPQNLPPSEARKSTTSQSSYFQTSYAPTTLTKKFNHQSSLTNGTQNVSSVSRSKKKKCANNENVYHLPLPPPQPLHLDLFPSTQQQQQFIGYYHQQATCGQQNLIVAAAAACVGNGSLPSGSQDDFKAPAYQNTPAVATPSLHTFLSLPQEFPTFPNLPSYLDKEGFSSTTAANWRPEASGYAVTSKGNTPAYPNVISAFTTEDARHTSKIEYPVTFPPTCSSFTTSSELPPFISQPPLDILKDCCAEVPTLHNNLFDAYNASEAYKNPRAPLLESTDRLQLADSDTQHLADFNFISEVTNTLLN